MEEFHDPPSIDGRVMNRRELIRALSDGARISVAEAKRVVDALFGTPDGIIPGTLRTGERVQIPGFGAFEARHREARSGHDPRTGREIDIAASTSAVFRPARALRDRILATEPAPREPKLATRGGAPTGSTGPRKKSAARGGGGG
jgi:DNA-binding protein HU-beta